MSIISSLLICILCLSSLPSLSTARHFGVVKKLLQNNTLLQDPSKLHSFQKVEMEKNSSKSSSKLENNNVTLVRVDEFKKMIKPQGARMMKANPQVVSVSGQGRRSQGHIINDEDQAIKRSTGITKSKFSESVNSWRVPRNKKRKEVPQTGFNLDYAPPKVHPPVHN